MALSTEELLLLNNLMYIENDGTPENPLVGVEQYQGQTIGEWLNSIHTEDLTDGKEYGCLTTGKDWKNIINSVKQNETLMNMTIATTNVDKEEGGGDGFSALFLDNNSHEAVVAFKGTAGGEWKDNFMGGNQISTPQQENALHWYQKTYEKYGLENYEITVTGHSKGGNKSKYITIVDGTVDHCVSFDGQGFSDKFFDKYKAEIAARQGKIENHNVDYDYVNLLLSDVGEKTYYTGQDLGNGGFFENHCPNTFMKYDENGNFTMEVNPNGQGKEMQALDEFFNSCLRSLPDGDRTEMLELVDLFVENGLACAFDAKGKSQQEIVDMFKEVMINPQYSDDLAYLLAYAIKYEQAHPEVVGLIRDGLGKFGAEDYGKYVDIISAVLNFELDVHAGPFGLIHIHLDFDMLFGLATGTLDLAGGMLDALSKCIPKFSWDSNWALEQLCKWIKDQTGITLSPQDLRELLKIIGMVDHELDHIRLNNNGADLKIESGAADSGGRPCQIYCDVQKVRSVEEKMNDLRSEIQRLCEEVLEIANGLSFSLSSSPQIKKSLLEAGGVIGKNAESAGKLGTAIATVADLYAVSEFKNLSTLLSR